MNYPLIEAKKEIIEILKNSLSKLNYNYNIELEIPNKHNADFCFTCFNIAKNEKKDPEKIGKSIIENINKDNKYIKEISQKGGYINFLINKELLTILTLKLIQKKNNKYGFLKNKNKKVIIEHTSANPNGPLHVGRARNPIIGDTLVRIYRAAGFNVESQFYLDDLGKQVAILAWGINNENKIAEDINKFYPGGSALFKKNKDNLEVKQRVVYYQASSNRMNNDPDVADEINKIVKHAEEGDKKTIEMIHNAYNPFLEIIEKSLKRINIDIDKYIPESKFIRDNSVDFVVDKLKKSKFCGKEHGSYYLDLKDFGIQGRNTKFFFLRKDGTTLYATRDIAYHIWKAKHADILINILGEDHKLESKQVEIVLNLLNLKNIPKPIFYSFVSMSGGKMSTRKGRVVYLDDLIHECIERAYEEVKKRRKSELLDSKMRKISEIIGIGALRYNIIKVQPEKDINFKWEDALNFEGNSAPFIQYAYARASGIISKIKNFNNKTDINFSILCVKRL